MTDSATHGPAVHPSLPPRRPPRRSWSARAFTLIELLVVIGIIVVLIGILLPVIAKVRIGAQAADTRNWVLQLAGAIDRYQQDFRAYPGPLANNEITFPSGQTYTPGGGYTGFQIAVPSTITGFDTASQTPAQMAQTWTMSENLVLGLLGGLHADSNNTANTVLLDYDPSAVGSGPTSLNLVGLPKRYAPYIDARQLSWQTVNGLQTGHYFDGAGAANDSMIPEFVDRFSDPMPILYLRAKVGTNPQGASVSGGTFTDYYNPIITDDLTEQMAQAANSSPTTYLVRQGQYDTSQYIAYTAAYTGAWPSLTIATAPAGASIGVGRSAKASKYTTPPANGVLYHGLFSSSWTAPVYPTMTANSGATYSYPYNAYPYFTGSANTARQKDGYILISAGPDRVYGTDDDITNFGTVGE